MTLVVLYHSYGLSQAGRRFEHVKHKGDRSIQGDWKFAEDRNSDGRSRRVVDMVLYFYYFSGLPANPGK